MLSIPKLFNTSMSSMLNISKLCDMSGPNPYFW